MSDVQDQLIDLETKVAYQEDTIQALNNVVCKQQDQIDRLELVCQSFSQRIKAMDEQGQTDKQASEPPPPHY